VAQGRHHLLPAGARGITTGALPGAKNPLDIVETIYVTMAKMLPGAQAIVVVVPLLIVAMPNVTTAKPQAVV
jgi:hypothetical protein